MFRWRRSPDAAEELLWPSLAWFPIFQELLPGKYPDESTRPSTVATRWNQEAPLGEIAEEHGIW